MTHSRTKHGAAEIVLLASMIVALGLVVILGLAGGFTNGSIGTWLHYYSLELVGSLAGFIYETVLFLCMVLIMMVIWALGKSFLSILFPKLRRRIGKNSKEEMPIDAFINAAKRSVDMLLVIPAILFVTIVAIAMGEANEIAPARLKDLMVIGWEHAIFSNYVFAALGAIHYPHWLIVFIIFSFENMSLILILAGIIMSYIAVDRFRELIIAFCIGILAMVPFWLLVPVLSPQDRFINDVYHLPNPPAIAAAVANYHPQAEIENFLQLIRANKAGLPALPTSTMPSAHVFWATIAGYYLFRTRRWLGWVALPFLAASTFGTILLAQHYFIDVPAGMAIAALAIWLAHRHEGFGSAA